MRALLLLTLLATPGAAQLSSPGRPASFDHELSFALPTTYVPRPDVAAHLAEDARRGPWPFRYGAVIAVELDVQHHGRWDQLEDGTLVWRARVASPGAYSLGVLFGTYDLPPGGELYAYAPGGRGVIGAFTDANEQPNGMLALQPCPGQELVLEYVQGPDVTGTPRLVVESVVHDYRDLFREVQLEGPSGSQRGGPGCLVDVNCAVGQPYQDVKRSVIGLFRGGFVCSGSLLNNTANDGAPLMLTAHHCGDFTNGTFLFNYERPGCNAGTATMSQFLSGAQLLAEDDFVDCQLYRLNSALPAAYTPFLAGWARSGSPGSPVVGISHPAGYPKKIQVDHDPPLAAGQQWSVTWDVGEIRGGSSGSPLFDAQQRVIGPLCCGGGACKTSSAFYGRLQRFWARRPIAQHLDPLGTGAAVLDGYDPYWGAATPYNGAGGNPDVYTADVPRRNAAWTATVDASGFPAATSTVLLGYTDPASGVVLGFGELLVDLSSTFLFRSDAPVSGGASQHTTAIPDDPSLAGLVAHTQATLLGPGLAQATNGVELRIQ